MARNKNPFLFNFSSWREKVNYEDRKNKPFKQESQPFLSAKIKTTRFGPPPTKDGIDYINGGEDDQMEILGFKHNLTKEVITWIFIVLTLGFLRLIFHWKPEWMLLCTHKRCSLQKAEKIMLKNHYSQNYVEEVQIQSSAKYNSDKHLANDKYSADATHSGIPLVVLEPGGHFKEVEEVRYFHNKKLKYLWNEETGQFCKVCGLDNNISCLYFHECKGLKEEQQMARRFLYGENKIFVKVKKVIELLFLEALNPFYIFQLYSVLLWYNDEYYYYASCIVVISAISITLTIREIRSSQKALRDTVKASDIVTVCKGSEVYEDIPSEHLVPGDVFLIPSHGCLMSCDAVLITGNCIVNESMLTGESVPVTKTPLPNPRSTHTILDMHYDPKEHAKHTLYCGTKVIQTRYYGNLKVKAVVIRTGFLTTKGLLVRSIIYPKPVDFKFELDALKFIGVLAAVAGCGFIATVIIMTMNNAEVSYIVKKALDLITICVPPALPAAMTVGYVHAQKRLKKSNVFCISPKNINICGVINLVCFDKTGTLTEDGLDMWGVVPVQQKRFQEPVNEVKKLLGNHLIVAMATCHSLTIIDGQLSGDPLDLIMFQATNWIFEEPNINETANYDVITPTVVRPKKPDVVESSESVENQTSYQVGILRQFTFSSSLQRMSVITRELTGQCFHLYTKGAPEMVASLSVQETVPDNFLETLTFYTKQGFRVLALAWKPLMLNYRKIQRLSREEGEKDLNFLGLLVMENRLKPETTPIIKILKNANIRTVMVTGDNMQTALSVARDCGMVERNHKIIQVNAYHGTSTDPPSIHFCYVEMPNKMVEEIEIVNEESVYVNLSNDLFHFAISGYSFDVIRLCFPEIMPKLVVRGTVFARMSPDQKALLVEELQDLGYYVAMCGDGANDCGALKAAHAGISLSEAEASVASPFTSKNPHIGCVPSVIREGRAALVTSFGVFKYMALYSLTQFVSVIILYTIGANLTDLEFLYIDLFLLTVLGIFFGHIDAYHILVKEPPIFCLISFIPLLSCSCQLVIMIATQVFAWKYVQVQPWFVPYKSNFTSGASDMYMSYENYSIFAISAFQYITQGIIFSKGAPYRKPIFTNIYMTVSIVVLTAFTLFLVLSPTEVLIKAFALQVPSNMMFKLILVEVAFISFLMSFITETFVIDYLIFQKIYKRFTCFKFSDFLYVNIERELSSCSAWPPIEEDDYENGKFVSCNNSPTAQLIEDSSDEEVETKRVRHTSGSSYHRRAGRTISLPSPTRKISVGENFSSRKISCDETILPNRKISETGSVNSAVISHIEISLTPHKISKGEGHIKNDKISNASKNDDMYLKNISQKEPGTTFLNLDGSKSFGEICNNSLSTNSLIIENKSNSVELGVRYDRDTDLSEISIISPENDKISGEFSVTSKDCSLPEAEMSIHL